MAYIKIIEPEEATGPLKDIYEDLTRKRGKLANVHKAQSLNPKSIVTHMELYMSIMFSKSPLSRAQREMIAVVVSAVNECEYCQLHHAEALNNYWKDQKKVDQLRSDYEQLTLNEMDLLLCKLAKNLTLKPSEINEQADIVPLKSAGLSERALLDATLTISYFNFVNRMILGLGLEADEEEVKGYKY
ncbi:MAG: peroxidase-related enzyme [Balneolaceae bacterium]